MKNSQVAMCGAISPWIRELESDNSRTAKKDVLKKALSAAVVGSVNAQVFLHLMGQAYDPFRVFHTQSVPESTNHRDRSNDWSKFLNLLDELAARQVTGHRARDRIAEIMSYFDSEEWNSVCRRVLLKDMRCGVSEKTINDVVGGTPWEVVTFTCQLARDQDGVNLARYRRASLEPKLDGVRLLARIQKFDGANYGVTLYSRNGHVLENFVDIEQSLMQLAPRLPLDSYPSRELMLDGEVMGTSFQQLMKQARRKKDAVTRDMVYNVFDIVLDEMSQEKRRELLLKFFNTPIANVKLVSGIDLVDLSTAEGRSIMERFAEESVAAGYEGIMIKDLDAYYEPKRSSAWLKWKPTKTFDLTVVGVEEGTGKNVGRLGAFICEGVDGGLRIRSNVGSGFSDQQRNQYWKERKVILGQTAEVEADAVTQNQDGSYSLRFPRFKTFRDDK